MLHYCDVINSRGAIRLENCKMSGIHESEIRWKKRIAWESNQGNPDLQHNTTWSLCDTANKSVEMLANIPRPFSLLTGREDLLNIREEHSNKTTHWPLLPLGGTNLMSHRTGRSPLWPLEELTLDLIYGGLSCLRENNRGGEPCANCIKMILGEARSSERFRAAFVEDLEGCCHPPGEVSGFGIQ